MRPPYHIPFWKQAPLIRLILPLIAGIILQWYIQFELYFILFCVASFTTAFLLNYFFQPTGMYFTRKLQGVIFYMILGSVGLLLTWQKDSRHNPAWYGHYYADSASILVRIDEPLIEKTRSFKADGKIIALLNGGKQQAATGKILLYFFKDSIAPDLKYGQLILIKKPLQPIKNSGNPGAFNYKRYAAFQLIYHQLFLKPSDWVSTGMVKTNGFKSFLYNTRHYVLQVLEKNVGNSYNELGIAKALLIGYKEELDKDLVQAYSNTGVVHIIAISGLHLGLIFFVLNWLFSRLPLIKKSKHIKAVLLIAGLWLFALLTGGSASVLRSAVMFTVIVIGSNYFKQASVYNSLAASAFILLCYNPYYLWDVGFQLSYLAITGIISLQQPIYRLWYIQNNWMRKVWQMASVTIAAQIAAFPICIYYFHQFPNLFMFTNLLVVPLSTIILFGEIFLIIISVIKPLAALTGTVLTGLIGWMNRVILLFDSFSFSLTDQIYADVFTTWLLYGLVVFCCGWLLQKDKKWLRWTLLCFTGFTALHALVGFKVFRQQKIVIYNISTHKAIDFIYKNNYFFEGDSALQVAGLQQNFHLKPARISLQANKQVLALPILKNKGNYWQFHHTKMLIIDSSILIEPVSSVHSIDILLISGNPDISIKDIIKGVKPGIIVFDASNPIWKIDNWKNECRELSLHYHSVVDKGAFIFEVK